MAAAGTMRAVMVELPRRTCVPTDYSPELAALAKRLADAKEFL